MLHKTRYAKQLLSRRFLSRNPFFGTSRSQRPVSSDFKSTNHLSRVLSILAITFSMRSCAPIFVNQLWTVPFSREFTWFRVHSRTSCIGRHSRAGGAFVINCEWLATQRIKQGISSFICLSRAVSNASIIFSCIFNLLPSLFRSAKRSYRSIVGRISNLFRFIESKTAILNGEVAGVINDLVQRIFSWKIHDGQAKMIGVKITSPLSIKAAPLKHLHKEEREDDDDDLNYISI